MLRNVGESLHSVVKEREHAGGMEMRWVATGGEKRDAACSRKKITLMLPSQKIFFEV